MNIAAPKVDEDAFNELFQLVNTNLWLKNYQSALIDLWNLCDVIEQRALLSELINRFTIISSYEMANICRTIVKQTEKWGVVVGRTFFVAIADPDELDGSTAGLNILKNKFDPTIGWKESHFIPNLAKAAYEVNSNSDIVLFDDFIGTGKKFSRKANWFMNKISERGIKLSSLRVCTFAAMEFGIENFTNETKLEVFTPMPLKKGISDHNNQEVANQKKLLMQQLENKLSPKFKKLRLSDHSLGYNGSESLFNIHEFNCPNNVFPIFWWPMLSNNISRKTVFSRAR